MFILLVSALLAYLVGSIPAAFIFAKIIGRVDIRKQGSGNIGATNVYRVIGKLPGILTLIVDIAKGAAAVGVLAPYFHDLGVPLELHHHQAVMALAVVSGHNWNPFLNFKGGKGIATSAGALLILCPGILGLVVLVWIITFALTKIISLSSIIASIAFPIIAAIIGNISITLLAIILCIISVVKHRSNIKRLIRGEERTLKL